MELEETVMRRQKMNGARLTRFCSVLALSAPVVLAISGARAEQPLPPCHPNPTADADEAAVRGRGDIVNLPDPLKDRLAQLANRPHTYLPIQAFAEADGASQLFQYYLLDTTGFEPNVFTAIIPGVNDGNVQLTVTGGNCGLPTIGTVRVVLEPKPGLPTDPTNPRAFIDIFTDISPLFVINNESGWYEGWMIHDVVVPDVGPLRGDGTPQFGMITQDDATALQAIGGGNNVPTHVFTRDGNPPRLPSASDHFPDVQSNVVPIMLSMGAYNCLQQSDCHSYWEFNQYTDWVFPLYELPFTGGFANEFADGRLAFLSSVVPGSGPAGTGPMGPGFTGGTHDPVLVGDNPNNPRDPDRLLDTSPSDPDRGMVLNDDHKEKRLSFIPSGLANEILLDTFVRVVSFEQGVPIPQRLFDAYKAEVARVDTGGLNGDGILTAVEVDLEDFSDGGLSNDRLFIPATQFNRFAVTREINDGLLAPRFAPSQRAWVQSGPFTLVSPSVSASIPQDADNR